MTKLSKVKIVWFASMLLLSLSTAKAQKALPEKIRISKGHCIAPCGFEKGFQNLKFDMQLEYNLSDSTFRYKRKANKKFKTLSAKPTAAFTNAASYNSLDSLFENFAAFNAGRGKYFIYRIELVYAMPGKELPAKIKMMEFYITTNPEKMYPVWMEQLIDAYNDIVLKS